MHPSLDNPYILCAIALAVLILVRAYSTRWRAMLLVTVIDGDTYMAVDLRGKRRKLRLYGVDCPELSQQFGSDAKLRVQQLSTNRWGKVRLRGKDKYHRFLADVRIEGIDLGYALVRDGLAYPLSTSFRLRLAYLWATVLRKGVHSVWFSKKPWEAKSRNRSFLGNAWHSLKRMRSYRS
jgi:micrococcal nuclease